MSGGDDRKKNPLDSALLKGFVAGVLVSHINKRFMIGALLGTGIGMFVEQNYTDVPDVKIAVNDLIENIKSSIKPKKMSSCLQCPVTAVKCYKQYLLTGQKSRLMVYSSKSGNLLTSKKLFDRNSIHKICEEKPGSYLVIGGKSVRRIRLNEADGVTISVEFVTREKELNGWIWDSHQIEEKLFLLISIHNTTIVWNSITNETYPSSSCDEQCILYSASIVRFRDEILVAAGTVFNQVLLWKPNTSSKHDVKSTYKRFCGHEGVIFSIRFHPTLPQLSSVSDDRSIRLWCIDTETCIRTFYGHTARVWDAIFLDDRIVSIGEDANCIIWNASNGSILKKYKGHKGKSIWSMDVDNTSIYTGGGDGGIRQLPLQTANKNDVSTEEYNIPEEIQNVTADMFKDKDFPRSIKFINHKRMLIFTNNGLLLRFDMKVNTWKILHQDICCHSYCVLEYKEGIVAFGNLKGTIKVLFEENTEVVFSDQIFDNGKVFSLSLLRLHATTYLLACGPEGHLKLFNIHSTIDNKPFLNLVSCFILPHSKQRWITDAVLYSKTPNTCDINECQLIFGDRRGSIHLYNTSSQDPIQSLLGVHGKTGVTSVSLHHNTLYTTGRDGHFRKYRVEETTILLDDKQKTCKGLEWIEGIWFHKNDIIVYGFFMQSHFAMWSYERNEILMKVQCGGGYRSWDIRFPVKAEEAMKFSFLKGSTLNITSSDWYDKEKCRIIKDGFHGKETLCAKVIGCKKKQDHNEWMIVTSSEDTTMNFLSYNDLSGETQLLHTTVGHIGGVKSLVFAPSSPNINGIVDGLLISCGSRTSLKIWNLFCQSFDGLGVKGSLRDHEIGSLRDDEIIRNNNSDSISCSMLTEIFNPEMNPKQLKLRTGEFIDDMRYLCCDVTSINDFSPNVNYNQKLCVCACSDGVARLYAFEGKHVELLCILGDKKHCVQTVKFYVRNHSIFVFATSTDGILAVWSINEISRRFENILLNRTNMNGTVKEISRVDHVNKDRHKFHELDVPLFDDVISCLSEKCHQSGINAIDLIEEINGDLLVVTGGDDNALSVLTLQISNNGCEVVEKIKNKDAHISSITGVKFVDNTTIVSTSIDQLVKFWNAKQLIKPITTLYTDVADVNSLEIWKTENKLYTMVTGFGIEIFCNAIDICDKNR